MTKGQVKGEVFASDLGSDYLAVDKISQGTFAVVFRGIHTPSRRVVALKRLFPTSKPDRVLMEVKCLQELGGKHNVVPLLQGVRVGGSITLVLPYFKHEKFQNYFYKMTNDHLRKYMLALLKALAHVHSLGYIHRDVKPANFLHRPGTDEFCLVDFGLAQSIDDFSDEKLQKKKKRQSRKRRKTTGSVVSSTPTAKKPKLQHQSPADPLTPSGAPPTPTLASGFTPQSSGYASPMGSMLSTASSMQPGGSSLHTPSHTPSSRARTPGSAVSSVGTPSPAPAPAPKMGSFRQSLSGSKTSAGKRAALKSHYNQMRQQQQQNQQLHSNVPPHVAIPAPLTPLASHNASPGGALNQGPVHLLAPPGHAGNALARSPSVLHRPNADYPVKRQVEDLPKVARCGTRGFRPPEVLMKVEKQGTAIDVWSAGIIMLCIMSRRYPFFRASCDMTALAELMRLFGAAKINAVARRKFDRVAMMCDQHISPAKPLRTVIRKLFCEINENDKRVEVANARPIWSDDAYHLLERCLTIDPAERITASEALEHPFLRCGSGEDNGDLDGEDGDTVNPEEMSDS